MDELAGRMRAVNAVAEKYNRTLDYGLRAHMIVRDTEKEAQEYADYIVSKLDDEYGRQIRERALDATSLGVSHQAKNREVADEFGYIEKTCGPVSDGRDRAVERRLSAPPIRSCPRSRHTARWASALSSSRATRIWTKSRTSENWSCRI
jgi:alkanesulfonate monooxygenase SsuD/methylene tetrahydromethanopterin reductase-like flavin-dependent oxidoreductase (luciferase family)